MTIVSRQEAQATLAQLLARVARGEDVLITEGNRPVARLTAATPADIGGQPVSVAEEEDQPRPWRGIFVWDRTRSQATDIPLKPPADALPPRSRPFDILWDRADRDDD
jgi:prevent-host-death family protein